MRIVVIGTRGFPGILGGVETHAEELYPRIAARGHDVTVIRRMPYVNDSNRFSEYKGVRLIDVFAPKRKSLEAITHTFLAVLRARKLRPDILHIHAVGPSLFAPLAKVLGLNVVVTNHGPDYNRQKWGSFAKAVLRLGERLGTRYASRVIVISETIAGILSRKYGRNDTDLIFNGVNTPVRSASRDYLDSLAITKPFILAAGRFVKEKGFHDLVAAYDRSDFKDSYQLVIAGDADHSDEYSESLKSQARDAGVVLTGFVKGEPLNQLMSNASLFVLPSYHEGLPITLLEAMSYGIDVVASDIPANRLRELRPDDFFKVGDVESLQRKIAQKLGSPQKRIYDLSAYDWDNIADRTLEVYFKSLQR